MILQDILYKVAIISVKGNTNIEVNNLQIDSRKIGAGHCFIAVKGAVANGHLFIETAIENGATVIVCEDLPVVLKDTVTYIQVENTAVAAGLMSMGVCWAWVK